LNEAQYAIHEVIDSPLVSAIMLLVVNDTVMNACYLMFILLLNGLGWGPTAEMRCRCVILYR